MRIYGLFLAVFSESSPVIGECRRFFPGFKFIFPVLSAVMRGKTRIAAVTCGIPPCASPAPVRDTQYATRSMPVLCRPRTADKPFVIPAILSRGNPELETYGRIDTIFCFDESL